MRNLQVTIINRVTCPSLVDNNAEFGGWADKWMEVKPGLGDYTELKIAAYNIATPNKANQ